MIDCEFLNELEFTHIVDKVGKENGWSEKEAITAQTEYYKMLCLFKHYDGPVVPLTDAVDKIWHQHIIDTYKYSKDCEKLFGKYLHHQPAYNQHQKNIHANATNVFNQRYESVFGNSNHQPHNHPSIQIGASLFSM